MDNYNWSFSYLDDYFNKIGKPKLILEIGSRDALDGITLCKKFNCK
jgi:hypothetical protein